MNNKSLLKLFLCSVFTLILTVSCATHDDTTEPASSPTPTSSETTSDASIDMEEVLQDEDDASKSKRSDDDMERMD